MQPIIDEFAAVIRKAAERQRSLRIRGGGTKDFYGGALEGEILDTRAYSGIVDYEPSELVLTARAGTPLRDIESALRDGGQMLAFEPPHFGDAATFGGCIAAGLSGPRRPYAGAARDLVLGVRMLDGKGTDLRFGGQVMKNVAGYDVSRLMVGSLGTLGLMLEVSIKVLPAPAAEMTLRREHSAAEAVSLMNAWAGKPLPISATCHFGSGLYVRLSGAEPAVRAAREKVGGEAVPNSAAFWKEVREQTLPFFSGAAPLWRISFKSMTPALDLSGPQLLEWNGALRWARGEIDAAAVRAAAGRGGGHATLFRGGDRSAGVFQPLPPPLHKLHQRLKSAFDPAGVLCRGRLYPDL